jgi:hypothetical protein
MKTFFFILIFSVDSNLFAQKFFFHADTFSFAKKAFLLNTDKPIIQLSKSQLVTELSRFESSAKYLKQSRKQLWHAGGATVALLGSLVFFSYASADDIYLPANKRKYHAQMAIIAIPVAAILFYKLLRYPFLVKKTYKAYNIEKKKKLL